MYIGTSAASYKEAGPVVDCPIRGKGEKREIAVEDPFPEHWQVDLPSQVCISSRVGHEIGQDKLACHWTLDCACEERAGSLEIGRGREGKGGRERQ